MPLDRTWYNALVDDDGSGTTGTIWNKAAVDALMDAIDASLLLLAPVVTGAWTPADVSGAGLTLSVVQAGSYTKIGRRVFVSVALAYPVTANGTPAAIGGLPFVSIAKDFSGAIGTTNYGSGVQLLICRSSSQNSTLHDLTGAQLSNAQLSGKTFFYSGTYEATT